MLFDPKWETKADPLSLSSLIAWLELQPGDKTYDADNPRECLLAQWAMSMDPLAEAAPSRHDPWSSFKYTINGRVRDLHAYRNIAVGYPTHSTFGAALDRARQMK